MIRPTPRAVAVFAAGVPLALLLVIYDPALWRVSARLRRGGAGRHRRATAARACRRGGLSLRVDLPETLYVGERGAITVAHRARATCGARRDSSLLGELRGRRSTGRDRRAASSQPGADAPAPVRAARRRGAGRIEIDACGCAGAGRWAGRVRAPCPGRRARSTSLPNVRGVRSAALQFFVARAVFGIKVQRAAGRRHRVRCAARLRARPRQPLHRLEALGAPPQAAVQGVPHRAQSPRRPRLRHRLSDERADGRPAAARPRDQRRSAARLDLAARRRSRRHLWLRRRCCGSISNRRRGIAELRAAFSAPPRELDYHHDETNFTLGLAELSARLKRRALVILFTDFVDTVTAELLVETMARIARQHVVVFVTLRDAVLHGLADAPPDNSMTSRKR